MITITLHNNSRTDNVDFVYSSKKLCMDHSIPFEIKKYSEGYGVGVDIIIYLPEGILPPSVVDLWQAGYLPRPCSFECVALGRKAKDVEELGMLSQQYWDSMTYEDRRGLSDQYIFSLMSWGFEVSKAK